MGQGILKLDAEDHSLTVLRDHTFELYARLSSEEPHTTTLIPRVATFLVKVDAAIAKQTSLADAVVLAGAGAVAADRGLNNVMRDVANAIHGGKRIDVSHPKHRDYFGGPIPVWEAQKPTLGAQLTLMESWPAKLAVDSQASVASLLGPTTDSVAAGTTKRDALQDAKAAKIKFDLYEVRDLFAEYNSMAAETLGALVSFAENHPDLRLPSDWPQSCFLRAARAASLTTIDDVDAELTRSRARTAMLEKKREELVQQAANDAKRAAEAEAAEAAAEEARQVEEQARKQREAAEEKARKAAKKKGKNK